MSCIDPRIQLLVVAMMLSPPLAEAGANAAVLRRLRDLSSDELVMLLNAGYPKVDVRLDPASLDHGMRMIRDRHQQCEQLEYFIRHGATTAMLRQLFRLPVAQIKALRGNLLGAHKQRRPSMPAPAQRDAIHAAWWSIPGVGGSSTRCPAAAQWLELHARFPACSFATLYAVINEFEDVDAASTTRRQERRGQPA